MKEMTEVKLFRICNFHFFSSVDLFLVIQIAVSLAGIRSKSM